jgi:HSP20 family protein
MPLIPWKTERQDENELSPAQGFRSEMDRLFDSFFGDSHSLNDYMGGGRTQWGPPLDVEETDKEIHVRAEIPGVKPEEFDIAISNNALVISGEKKESEEKREKGYVYQERRYGSFHREVLLPTAVDAKDVQAEYKDGVLSVILKKSQEGLPKKIQVKAK